MCLTKKSDNIGPVKQKMKNIINIAAAGDALQNPWQTLDNLQLFEPFVSYYLIHFITLFHLQYNTSSVVIFEIFTPLHETLCILLLENSAADYVAMYCKQNKIDGKEAKPKWTKS